MPLMPLFLIFLSPFPSKPLSHPSSMSRREVTDIDAQCARFKQTKNYTVAQASFDQWAGNDLKDIYRILDANKLGVAFDTAFPTDPNTRYNCANLTTSYGYRKAMELKLCKCGCPSATRDLLGDRVVKNGADNKANHDTIDSDKLLWGALVLNNPRLLQHFNALLPPTPFPLYPHSRLRCHRCLWPILKITPLCNRM